MVTEDDALFVLMVVTGFLFWVWMKLGKSIGSLTKNVKIYLKNSHLMREKII